MIKRNANNSNSSQGKELYRQALEKLKNKNMNAAYSLLLDTIHIDATISEAWNDLATIMKIEKKYAAALVCARKALATNPDNAIFQTNLGDILFQMQRYDEAKIHLQIASEIDSSSVLAWFNLTHINLDEGNFSQAINMANKVAELLPGRLEAQSLRALALLASGNFEEGWKESEVRIHGPAGASFPKFNFPQWQGESLVGKKLYIYTEQGFGDSIQFIRYLRALPSEVDKILIEVPEALLGLFKISFSDLPYQFIAKGENRPTADYHIPLLSLPSVLGSKANFSDLGSQPYLIAPMSGPKIKPAKGTKLSIGVCWSGNPNHPNDNSRSASIQEFCDELFLPDIELFSLQPNAAMTEPSLLGHLGLTRDLSSELSNFADTATVLQQLDCVVTVDTVIAHLAGALGCPCYVLLPYYGLDWRWGNGQKSSSWYPSLQLYRRQPQDESWRPLLRQVRDDLLRSHVSEHEQSNGGAGIFGKFFGRAKK